jgi:hypothetical protein
MVLFCIIWIALGLWLIHDAQETLDELTVPQ